MSLRWISTPALLLLHGESLSTHGGAAGLRDEGLLDFALAQPLNLVAYAQLEKPPDIAALAASYTAGIAQNHPFVDGNKRAAFLATGLFFYLNGYRLSVSQVDATVAVLGLAAGELSEDDCAAWLRSHVVPRAPVAS